MSYNLPIEKKILIVSQLAEGTSIRAIERIRGVHRDTIMRLGVRVGEACAKLLDAKMRGLACRNIEVDEIWGFIGKNKNVKPGEDRNAVGDAWTFIALDSDSKLIPSFLVGKRDSYHAKVFMDDLSGRLKNRVQISSDALAAYVDAVERGFGSNVDYAQLVQTYSIAHLGNFKEAASRYSPAEVVKAEKTIIAGFPDVARITTSHFEKQKPHIADALPKAARLMRSVSNGRILLLLWH